MQQTNPYDQFDAPQGGSRPGMVITDPYRARDEQRKDSAQSMEQTRIGFSGDENARSDLRSRIQNAQALRQEYSAHPAIKEYRVALSQAEKALTTASTPQGDIALTYAYAKAMDPTSAVRDGENQMAMSTQPWVQAQIENIKKQFGVDGSGNFTPEARAHLRREIISAAAATKAQYDQRRAEMADIAKANGIDPYQVIGKDDTALYAPAFRAYAEKTGDQDGLVSGLIGGAPIKPIAGPGSPGATGPRPPDAKMAGAGATETAVPIPPQMQQEHAAYLAQHWGQLDPRDYSMFRIGLDQKYGFQSDPEGYRGSIPAINRFAAQGGTPDKLEALAGPMRQMSPAEQFQNSLVANPVGAGIATTANGIGFGIPEMLAGDKMGLLRKQYPKSAIAGDIVGGVAGAMSTGGLFSGGAKLAGEGALARILAKPLAADMAYGATYGANTAIGRGESPITGALTGAAGGFIGNKAGGAITRAFPRVAGMSGRIGALDETVPTSQQLKDTAASLYQQAESKGLTATPAETDALSDTFKNILLREGRLTPKDNLTDVQPKVKEAFRLVGDYAGQPMTPKQIGTVRGVISDGLGSAEPSERRISGMLLDNFDNWTDNTNPDLSSGLADARAVASRYLQGDKVASLGNLAEEGAGQYSNAGMDNSLRVQYRQFAKGLEKGTDRVDPFVRDAVQNVNRGNPISNALRYVGKFAPTGPISTMALATGVGAGGHTAGALGAGGVAGLGGLAVGSRALSQALTKRAAQVAENTAYGGQPYADALTALLDKSAVRGGHGGAGIASTTISPLIAQWMRRPLFGVPIAGDIVTQ